jgi:hypothetical protein
VNAQYLMLKAEICSNVQLLLLAGVLAVGTKGYEATLMELRLYRTCGWWRCWELAGCSVYII